jgi:uncharacterized protein YegL
MFCLHCGSAIEDGDIFCENCGQKVQEPQYIPCVHCGQLSDDADAFCEFCGNKVTGSVSRASNQYTTAPGTKAVSPPPSPPIQPRVKQTPNFSTFSPKKIQPKMPLIFLLDTSTSAAQHINQLIISLSQFIMNVCTDEIAKDALDMAIIHFSDNFEVLQDLPDITSGDLSELVTTGKANFTAPIREALKMVDEYNRNNTDIFKPWVVMVVSCEPSDDITTVAKEIQDAQNAEKLRLMILNLQENSSASLKNLTDIVFRQKGIDFTDFFDWLCECINVIIRTSPNEKPSLPPLEGNVYRDR